MNRCSAKWVLGIFLAPCLAFAQQAVEINTDFFRPIAGNGFFGIEGARVLPHLNPQFAAMFNLANDPLILVDNDNDVVARIVDAQTVMDLSLALGLFDRLELAVTFPLLLVQDGERREAFDGGPQVAGGQFGDIRLGAKVALLDQKDREEGFFLAFAPELTFPTGNQEQFFGAASASGLLSLVGEYHTGRFSVGASAGPRFQEPVQVLNLDVGNVFEAGAGVAYEVAAKTTLIGEIESAFSLQDQGVGQNPLETRLGARFAVLPGLSIPVGLGFGLANGVGSPNVRLFAGVMFSPSLSSSGTESDVDIDGDGLVGRADKCPEEAEDFDNFRDRDGCPDLDHDEDGILNTEDMCPEDPGVPLLRGCPDRDNDQIADIDDQCPREAEDFDNFEDEDGCPDTDNDNDTFTDATDLCPMIPEDGQGDKPTDGCPSDAKAVFSDGKLFLLEKIFFDTNKDTIKTRSYPILDAVVEVLKENPQIILLQIQGHTDDVGADTFNQDLSERRANRVLRYLVSKGIDASRLTSQGYGESEPLESIEGKTDQTLETARQKNRRVEFVILEQE